PYRSPDGERKFIGADFASSVCRGCSQPGLGSSSLHAPHSCSCHVLGLRSSEEWVALYWWYRNPTKFLKKCHELRKQILVHSSAQLVLGFSRRGRFSIVRR
ncbi:unnamed protein product, partial [Scytosiphon promiscuus]